MVPNEPRSTREEPGFAALPTEELLFKKLVLFISWGGCFVGFPLLIDSYIQMLKFTFFGRSFG